MEFPTIFVFSNDAMGDGEDGSPARRAARFLPGHPRASFCGAG